MFDDLRDLSGEPVTYEDFDYEEKPRGPERRIFGMTAVQRFILSLMLLVTVVVLGSMCLLVTERVWLLGY